MQTKLTAAAVARKLKQPGRHRVSENLYLQVKPSGTASWLFRYTLDGDPHWMGLGSYSDFSLEEARQRARDHRQLKTDKLDPLEAKRAKLMAAKLEAAKAVTFQKCAEEYIAAHSVGWKNAKHRAQWPTSLKTYVYPEIGELPVASIDTTLVLKVLQPIWTEKTETASRVRQRIEAVLDFAKTSGYRTGDNPARWAGHLENLLAKPSKVNGGKKHHPALAYAELPEFMAELRGNNFVSARALEFTILTAARSGEVIGATWDEVDFAEKIWTIPAKRTKAGNEHKVPLSDRALEILSALPREDGNPHLFIGGKKGAPLSSMAMLRLLRDIRPGYVPHGFRSTFRTWCAERTSYPHIVCELALGPYAIRADAGVSARRPVREAREAHGRMGALLHFACGRQRREQRHGNRTRGGSMRVNGFTFTEALMLAETEWATEPLADHIAARPLGPKARRLLAEWVKSIGKQQLPGRPYGRAPILAAERAVAHEVRQWQAQHRKEHHRERVPAQLTRKKMCELRGKHGLPAGDKYQTDEIAHNIRNELKRA